MKILLTILLLIPSLAFGWGVASKQGVSGGWSCSSGSTTISYTDTTDASFDSTTTDAQGQSFLVSSDLPLHSIEVRWGYADSCNATMRIGTSTDLSTYIAEASITGASSGDWSVFDMSAAEETLTSGTYYIGLIEDSGDCRVNFDESPGYADGAFYQNGTGWTLGSMTATHDMLFRINECQ